MFDDDCSDATCQKGTNYFDLLLVNEYNMLRNRNIIRLSISESLGSHLEHLFNCHVPGFLFESILHAARILAKPRCRFLKDAGDN